MLDGQSSVSTASLPSEKTEAVWNRLCLNVSGSHSDIEFLPS
jgi:hypothetical protein